jgi:coenzyme F420-reducing hydrogenase beta subunit
LACNNQTAESADISLGDAWLPRYISSDKLGTNIIICRTKRGKMLLNRMANENLIYIEKASPEDVITSQGNCLVGKKIGAWANHLQIQEIDQQTIKIVKDFFYDHVPNKEMIIERRIYRWFARNFPNKAYYLFIGYNFIIKGVQILYKVYDAFRKK